ncbi:MAG: UvrB/UvrC motif-containing protein [Armatimonadetes bacterium]|nr:UvrB/UvrC motif-containing protein [Armatimonadota bacterium]
MVAAGADPARLIQELEKQMKKAASQLQFEKAALIRDRIIELKKEKKASDEGEPEWRQDAAG